MFSLEKTLISTLLEKVLLDMVRAPSPLQMLPGQMSPRQLGCVKDGPRNLCLKFGQNLVSNS